MKILIPVLGFGKSGGYRVLSKLADELIKLGNHVTFLSSNFSNQPYFPTMADIIWVNSNGKTQSRPNQKPGNLLKYIFSLRNGYKTLQAANAFDVILVSHPILAYFLPKRLRPKVVYYSQAYEPDYYFNMGGIKNFILGKISERSYELGLYTIVNAPFFQNFKKLHSDKVLLPGIDHKLFHPRDNIDTNKEKIIIGTIGRPEPYKGSEIIFRTIEALVKDYPNLVFHAAYCPESITNKIPGAASVFPKNDAELADYYRSLHLYVCAGTIHHGAFHYPVAEAMACGVSVVTTTYYPATETNAFIVNRNGQEELTKQIRYAISDRKSRSEKVAQALKDVGDLSWEKSGRELHQLLLEKSNVIKSTND